MIQTIRRFLAFSGRERRTFFLTIAVGFVHALFDILRLAAIAYVLAAILTGEVGSREALVAFGIMALSVAGSFATQHYSTLNQLLASYRMVDARRREMGDLLHRLPMGYFNATSLGTVSTALTSTIQGLQDLGARAVLACLQGVVATVVITGAVFAFDARIALIELAGIAVFMLANAWLQKRARRLDAAMVKANAKLEGAVLGYVRGMGVVKAYGLDERSNTTIIRELEENGRLNLRLEKAFIPPICLQSAILKTASVAMVLASACFYLEGSMGLMECLLMIIISFFVYGPLETAGNNSSFLRSVDKNLDVVNAVRETRVMAEGSTTGAAEEGDLELDHVSFSYGSRCVIDDVSLTVPQGSTCALVGPSGSGKTTLVQLMARFWDPDAGRVLLGGRPLPDYRSDALMAHFSMVFQNPYLFNDTIENNIRFGRPDATHDEVVWAAKRACCHEFVSALPHGYDTQVGEGGAMVSGGEKQRISIARALLKDAPVVFLDEATANVDPENEAALQASLAELTRGKTVVTIAHRLKTVADADQIIVLEKGRIVQRGTHAQLMIEGGRYARFVGLRETAAGWRLRRTPRAHKPARGEGARADEDVRA